MEARSVRISWKIMMVPPICALLVGLILTVAPGISVAQNFQSFMGQPWADFVASNAKLGAFLSMLSRVLGVQLIISAIVAIAITLTAYRRGEKWSWYILLVGNTLGYGSGLVWEAATDLIPILVVYAIILLVAYVGLAISAKAILTKASN